VRTAVAVLIGRAIRVLARLRGGGSALPGRVALLIAPQFLQRSVEKLPLGVVFVSGSNGKSTTTQMLVSILRAHGVDVFTNPSGANLPQGIASAVLADAPLDGRLRHEIAVLEVDEAFGFFSDAANLEAITPPWLNFRFLGYAEPLAEGSLLAFDSGRLVGVGLRFGSDTVLYVDPDVDPAPAYAQLLPWFADRPGRVEVLNRDAAAIAAIEAAGWTYDKSAFDLIAEVTPELRLAEPRYPVGIAVTGFRGDDDEAVHRLIYVDAGWAEVPGHPDREFADWHKIFITEHTIPSEQVIAWRGDRVVGVAMGRTWDDGTGWISQLAPAVDERGRGLGRAMLLEALRRKVAAGATSLGLGVQAENKGALNLYLGVGLEIDREFRTYQAPTLSAL